MVDPSTDTSKCVICPAREFILECASVATCEPVLVPYTIISPPSLPTRTNSLEQATEYTRPLLPNVVPEEDEEEEEDEEADFFVLDLLLNSSMPRGTVKVVIHL